MKKLKPTNDYVFKKIFGSIDSEDITREFIKSATGLEFEDINLDTTPILEKDLIDKKIGILDVKVVADKINNIDIEMQVVKSEHIAERILFYWSKMYNKTIRKGYGYERGQKAICILIADFKLSNLIEVDKFYTRWKIMEENYTRLNFTDKLYIVIIELEKIKDIKETENKELLNWCKFIKNPEEMEGEEMKNKYIKKAKEKLDEINQSEEERRLAEIRERTIRDEMAIRDSGYIDGKNDGIEIGIKEGEKKGKIEGRAETKKEMIKEMLKNNISFEVILKITHMSRNEVEELIDFVK